MADIALTQPWVGNTSDELWLKIATAFQAYAGVISDGSIPASPPSLGNPYNPIRATYALQSLVP